MMDVSWRHYILGHSETEEPSMAFTSSSVKPAPTAAPLSRLEKMLYSVESLEVRARLEQSPGASVLSPVENNPSGPVLWLAERDPLAATRYAL
jgi:hypothetical protein